MNTLFLNDAAILGELPRSRIKLVVLILSFNQAEYLADAVESVLSQDYNDEYLLVIHDDASNDRSAEIIRKLASENPSLILGILQKDNKFSVGVNILEEVHNLIESEYLARLDADDLWLSKNKLSTQIEFLDNNEDVSISAHSVLILDEVSNQVSLDLLRKYGFTSQSKFAFCNFISTASVVYRVKFFAPLPSSFTDYYIQDWPLWSILASRGKLFIHDDLLSIYRIHATNGFARKANSVFASDTLAINRMIGNSLNVDLLNVWKVVFVLRSFSVIIDRFTFCRASTVLNRIFNLIAGIKRQLIQYEVNSECFQIVNRMKVPKSNFLVHKNASNWLSSNE